MADIEKTGAIFRVLAAVSPVSWNKISFWGKASDVQFNHDSSIADDINTVQYRLGGITGISSDVGVVDETKSASTKLVNYIGGEKAVFSLPVAAWSAGTTTVNGTEYHTQEVPVASIILSHPVMYLAIDSIPTDDERDAWGELEMIADTVNNKLVFYSEDVPTVALSVGVKGVIKAS